MFKFNKKYICDDTQLIKITDIHDVRKDETDRDVFDTYPKYYILVVNSYCFYFVDKNERDKVFTELVETVFAKGEKKKKGKKK